MKLLVIDDLIMSSSGLRPLLQTLPELIIRDSILPRFEIGVYDVKITGSAFRLTPRLRLLTYGIVDEFFKLAPGSWLSIFVLFVVSAIVASIGIGQRTEKQEDPWCQPRSSIHDRFTLMLWERFVYWLIGLFVRFEIQNDITETAYTCMRERMGCRNENQFKLPVKSNYGTAKSIRESFV